MKTTSATVDRELNKLAESLSKATDSFLRFLRVSLGSREQNVVSVTMRPSRRSTAPQRTQRQSRPRRGASLNRWPWEEIMSVATTLLREQPQRRWRAAEFCKAIREAGAEVSSTRGMHFGLIPRLKNEGLIAEAGKGLFTARRGTHMTSAPRAKRVNRRGPRL